MEVGGVLWESDSLVAVHVAVALRLLCSALRVTLSLLLTRVIYCVTLNICCELFMQCAVSLLRGGCHDGVLLVYCVCEGYVLRCI